MSRRSKQLPLSIFPAFQLASRMKKKLKTQRGTRLMCANFESFIGERGDGRAKPYSVTSLV